MDPRHVGSEPTVNSGGLTAELAEDTLFGHVRGAFTGAHRTTVGRFEEAAGGSVFLDEIGDMPTAVQVKLLTVLQTGRIRPLGA